MSDNPRFVLWAPRYESVPTIRCSPPSWMAHALLEDKGADYRVRWLDFAKGEHKSDELRRLNPAGTVPVLAEGEAVSCETLAILETIEHRCDGPAWLPTEPVARARALDRLHASAAIKDAGMRVFRALMRDAATADDWAALHAELARFDAHLEDAPYLAGDAPTLGDLCVMTYFATALSLGLDASRHGHLGPWLERLRARPALASTWPATLTT